MKSKPSSVTWLGRKDTCPLSPEFYRCFYTSSREDKDASQSEFALAIAEGMGIAESVKLICKQVVEAPGVQHSLAILFLSNLEIAPWKLINNSKIR